GHREAAWKAEDGNNSDCRSGRPTTRRRRWVLRIPALRRLGARRGSGLGTGRSSCALVFRRTARARIALIDAPRLGHTRQASQKNVLALLEISDVAALRCRAGEHIERGTVIAARRRRPDPGESCE